MFLPQWEIVSLKWFSIYLQRIGIFICNSLIEKKFLTTANYQFGPGFKPGQYELVDISANFGIMAQVLDTGSEVHFLILVYPNEKR